jgi:hypothetical protein
MLRLAILIGLVTAPAVASASDTEARGPLHAFQGRSGATRTKLLVTSCGTPGRELHGGLVPAFAAQVKGASGGPLVIDKLTLRNLAEQWSSRPPREGPKTKEEIEKLLRQLPPKYRQLVKDYFDKLEKK